MATVTDPYAVLGIPRTADKDEIKKAYRKLAKQYHPDTHPNDPVAAKKMNEINQAYDMLTNPENYRNTGPSAGSYTYGNPFGYGNYGYGNYRNGTCGNGANGSGGQDQNYREYRNFWDMYDETFEKQGMDSRQYREFQERLRRAQQNQSRRRQPSLLRLLWRGFWFLLLMEFLLRSCAPVGYYYYDPYENSPYGYEAPYSYEQQLQELPGGNSGYGPVQPEGSI